MVPPPDRADEHPHSTQASYYDGNMSTAITGGNSVYDRMEKQVVRERMTPDARGIILVMVGLPARGKSFISRRVERFLQWRGLTTKSFNVGKYRREANDPSCSGKASFFDSSNQSAMAARENAAISALDDCLSFLDGGGKVGILDATNSTADRRKKVVDYVRAHKSGSYSILFVETVCNDRELLDANMMEKVRNSPDFSGLSPAEALKDLRDRIKKYEDVYETVEDQEGAYIKLYNLSSKVMVNHCYGRIAKSVLPYMMAIHIGARPVWLVRAGAGQQNPNCHSKSDRNALLSARGRKFAGALAKFVRGRAAQYWEVTEKRPEGIHVVTSTMSRAIASVCYTSIQHEQTSALNPIDKGVIGCGWWDVECPGEQPPWFEVEQRHPEFAEAFRKDPLRTRFPGGESYWDVIRRLEGLLVEVEMCTRPVLIVSHITALQPLIAYFSGVPVEKAWKLEVPKDAVFEVTPSLGGGFLCKTHDLRLDDAAIDAEADDFGVEACDEGGFAAGDSPDGVQRAESPVKRGPGEMSAVGVGGGDASKRQRTA